MKLFVIHRFRDKRVAKSNLKDIEKKLSIEIKLIFLDSSGGEGWKSAALNAIEQAEAIVIFDKSACEESENAKWEIGKAKESGKKLIYLDNGSKNQSSYEELKLLYDFKQEFDDCFSSKKNQTLELYKMMLDASESLIQRRQKTNAFFIAAIGSLITIAGLLVKTDSIGNIELYILYVIGLLICNSWRNLVDNYGKLNKAKFDVILRLEKDLNYQIYSAEWVALGKGLRPKKYKSFTSTEKNVPLWFGLLILCLILLSLIRQIF
jgi:hypothetical protein